MTASSPATVPIFRPPPRAIFRRLLNMQSGHKQHHGSKGGRVRPTRFSSALRLLNSFRARSTAGQTSRRYFSALAWGRLRCHSAAPNRSGKTRAQTEPSVEPVSTTTPSALLLSCGIMWSQPVLFLQHYQTCSDCCQHTCAT